MFRAIYGCIQPPAAQRVNPLVLHDNNATVTTLVYEDTKQKTNMHLQSSVDPVTDMHATYTEQKCSNQSINTDRVPASKAHGTISMMGVSKAEGRWECWQSAHGNMGNGREGRAREGGCSE